MRGPFRPTSMAAKLVMVGAALVLLPLVGAQNAAADPVIANGALLANVTSANGSYVEKVVLHDNRNLSIYVHSASMDETFEVEVQRPADSSVPRPTLYLLNGAGGGVDAASWKLRTTVGEFLDDKNVNTVSPRGGAWSYYTDWKSPDPVLGTNKWKTFLTQELPPIIDAGLGTDGNNAIAGLSSSGTSVLNVAQSSPGLYKSVASYSGCAQTADPIGQEFVKLTVETWGGGKVKNMYGADNDPMWAENDPYIHAEKLRGTALYISSGNGLPGIHDQVGDPHALPGGEGIANQIIIGGIIEAATNYCSHNMQNKLNQLGIPATYNFRNSGTHSWGYWEDDFKSSWPVIAGPLGI
jgi:diacylglycerol O-acyltransferase / trehalose O-mycolyltransferase